MEGEWCCAAYILKSKTFSSSFTADFLSGPASASEPQQSSSGEAWNAFGDGGWHWDISVAMDEKIFRDFHFHLFKFQRLTSNTLIWTSNMRHTHTHRHTNTDAGSGAPQGDGGEGEVMLCWSLYESAWSSFFQCEQRGVTRKVGHPSERLIFPYSQPLEAVSEVQEWYLYPIRKHAHVSTKFQCIAMFHDDLSTIHVWSSLMSFALA